MFSGFVPLELAARPALAAVLTTLPAPNAAVYTIGICVAAGTCAPIIIALTATGAVLNLGAVLVARTITLHRFATGCSRNREVRKEIRT